jgi:hypothetical protein
MFVEYSMRTKARGRSLLNNGDRKLREITIVDDSKTENLEEDEVMAVTISIWGDSVDEIKFTKGELIGLKSCRTNEYRGGIQLNASEENGIYRSNVLRAIKE